MSNLLRKFSSKLFTKSQRRNHGMTYAGMLATAIAETEGLPPLSVLRIARSLPEICLAAGVEVEDTLLTQPAPEAEVRAFLKECRQREGGVWAIFDEAFGDSKPAPLSVEQVAIRQKLIYAVAGDIIASGEKGGNHAP